MNEDTHEVDIDSDDHQESLFHFKNKIVHILQHILINTQSIDATHSTEEDEIALCAAYLFKSYSLLPPDWDDEFKFDYMVDMLSVVAGLVPKEHLH